MEPVGFGIATVHTEHEKDLARKVGARELPHMILLLDGKVIHYKDPQFSAVKAIEFVRRKFPYKMVEIVDDTNVEDFLTGWMDNRVRVLLFGHVSILFDNSNAYFNFTSKNKRSCDFIVFKNKNAFFDLYPFKGKICTSLAMNYAILIRLLSLQTEMVRLRYLTTAFRYRQRAAIGFVQIHDPNSRKIIKEFGVPSSAKTDTLLLFHENPKVPVASVSMKDLSINTMSEVIEANQFLQVRSLE